MTPMEQGASLLAGGRFHEALAVFAKLVPQMPNAVEPRVGLARAYVGTGDGWSAAAWLSDACRVAPQRAELWLELARMLHTQNRKSELEPLLATAVAANPDHRELLQAQGEALMNLRRYEAALVPYARLRELEETPTRATLLHTGFCLEQTGRIDDAAEFYRKAIALDPDFMEAHVDLAGVLWRLEDFDGAMTHAQRAVALAPDHPYAVRIMGTALLGFNRVAEAEVYLRRSLELLPDFALAQVDLSLSLLLEGRLEEGWQWYEKRWNDTTRMQRPSFFMPDREWKGTAVHPLRGNILVYAEQGLGDVIQFMRYIPFLQRDGGIVRCVVQPELGSLVEASFEDVLCLGAGRNFETYYHVALLDLPLRYGTTLDTIPAAVPYAKTTPAKRAEWQARMKPWAGRFKVGLAWSGSHVQVNNRNRAMPLSTLRGLFEHPRVQCFSLQKSDAGVYTDMKADPERLVDLTGEWRDFTDSAAMMQELDLVITVDTAVAHLAGALARPVWILLGPNADWRWLLHREDSPWYPTARLFRRDYGEARTRHAARVVAALDRLLET
ncbi:MAG TPA: tetratricopeptide repeat protein [Ramlibacter sp.]|uniref:tetratricopeptide repeat protein n=1 Tax=Ramlibacter sp. TaxID=1917967 RepID=UPI002C2C36EA|nr:tetratricopeptide repeat protein [Ramlibacter sp.]HVZ45856.1 tetratricopeptide repeat protein [Ramlibacter sp.]